MQRALIYLAVSLVSWGASGLELEEGTYLYGDDETPPAPVMGLQDCEANARTPASRRAFAGGYIFAIKCASNQENYVETLIFAEREDGTGAQLLLFPLPAHRGGGIQDTLSNIRWLPDTREIGEIFIDREVDERVDPKICRTEGRWRLDGKPPEPKLVFWRETADCEGETGWEIMMQEQP